MFKYIIKRLLLSVIILFGVSVIIYTLMRLMPTNYIDDKFRAQLAQGSITQEQVDEFKKVYGIYDNSFGGILKGYFSWMWNFIRGDLGNSFKYQKPVGEVISKNMWISFAIAIIATVLQFLIAIPMGITSATHQYSVRDYTVTVFTMLGNLSLPTHDSCQ